MKKTFLFTTLLLLSGLTLGQNIPNIKEFTKDDNNVRYYKIKANSQGVKVKEGDVIKGKFAIYYGDSLMLSTMDKPSSYTFGVTRQNNLFKGDLMDALLTMHQGETTIFAFDKDSMKVVQANLPDFKGDYVFYIVEIDSLTTFEQLQKEQEEMFRQQKLVADSMNKIEQGLIATYLKDNKWDTTLYDGIYVKKIKSTNDNLSAAEGDMVYIHYTGRLLEGKVFDTSIDSVAKANNIFQQGRPYEPLSFQMGTHRVIAGFESAAKQMHQGDIIEVLIPSYLAYGERGAGGVIKPFTPLIFTMEMVKIEKPAKTNK